jgi:predicted Zn-ribbon and HTH transcriptional regulator
MKDKVKIICKKHNLIFEQSLDSRINKNARCPNCASESNLKIKTDRTKTEFIKKKKRNSW